MKVCNNCGNHVSDGNAFCDNCGARVEEARNDYAAGNNNSANQTVVTVNQLITDKRPITDRYRITV